MTTTLLRAGVIHSPVDPSATALVVQDGVVAWVGDEAGADGYVDGVGEVVDLAGALVTPAFVDAHVHSTSTGLALTGLDLTGCPSLAAALSRVEDLCRQRRGLGVLLGHGWDETTWPEGRPPTRTELDRASYGGVVYLSRTDVHSAAVSSALLAAVPEAVGLPGYSPDGVLTRDAHHAARAVALGSLTAPQQRLAQQATREHAAALGIAAIHELGGPGISSAEDFAGVLALARQEPGPEVVGYWGELARDGGVDRAHELGALGAAGDLFADGALGSHTACLRSPYSDLPGDDAGGAGFGYLSAADVRDHVVACTLAGVQAGFHVIGDGAIDAVVAGFREAAEQVGADAIRARRHRLEHLEMPDAEHLATLGALAVHASVQPLFDELWGGSEGMYAGRLGSERALAMNPLAAIAAAGLPLAFGSDAPVTPLGPWEAVRAAASHRTHTSRLSVQAAFIAHTRGGWRAAGVDDTGVLAPGSVATYAVWAPGRPADEPALPDLSPGVPAPSCLLTVVRGRPIWTRPGALD